MFTYCTLWVSSFFFVIVCKLRDRYDFILFYFISFFSFSLCVCVFSVLYIVWCSWFPLVVRYICFRWFVCACVHVLKLKYNRLLMHFQFEFRTPTFAPPALHIIYLDTYTHEHTHTCSGARAHVREQITHTCTHIHKCIVYFIKREKKNNYGQKNVYQFILVLILCVVCTQQNTENPFLSIVFVHTHCFVNESQ